MKLSKSVVAPVIALLLGSGLVAAGGASSASAAGALNHQPLACKMTDAVIGGLIPEHTCGYRGSTGGASGTPEGGSYWGYDKQMFTDTKDFSPWEVLNNKRLFPSSDSGYNCMPSPNGSNLCTRSTAQTPLPGIDNASLSQLKSESNRGSVLSWVEDDTIECVTSLGCFKTTVVFTKYTAEAMYTYSSSGQLNVPQVSWYKNDGKGYGNIGTYLGTSRGFLTTESPSADDMEPANTVTTSSTITPTEVTAPGGRADYTLTVRASTAGSTLVRLKISGLSAAVVDSIPSDWMRFGTQTDEYVSYLIPHMNAGDVATARLHFTVQALSQAVVAADANGATAGAHVDVRPAAPVCTDPGTADGKSVAAIGSAPTTLWGVLCHVQASTDLKAWTGNERGAGTFTISSNEIRYTPPTSTFVGDDTIYVYTENGAGVASPPTAIHLRVGGSAVSANDEYSVAADSTLAVDAAHGVAANDLFASGRDDWNVVVDDHPAVGTVTAAPDGSFRFEPQAAFTGDVTFTYHLVGPAGQAGEQATATIHVTSDEPPTALLGKPYQYVLAAMQGASAKFEVTTGRLPAGLKVDQGTGTISGTPTKAGDYHFVVKVTGEGASELRAVDLTVSDPAVSGDM
ncbi:hypothetical protein C5B96_13480 [Subtercola sp. Z020]|uniref:putative Ig domain-containing protein n=1 Tax=Subtercola sp. Z020 TaxID=2080582 RepID=UPI000CE85E5E|nr:putative Ig domain-containing protein [Subtercola sp. Z020]PPF79055.1 hypothetical protein C5B96_13480 [Subtercola sp. Z020]